MTEPSVAVVIPVLNGARHVLEAVRSVHEQTDVDVELLVVDNGSTDETQELLAQVGARVTTEPLPGAGAARRRGLAETNAPFVLFLDHDDLLSPGALAALAAGLADGRHDVVHGMVVNESVRPGVQNVGMPLAGQIASATMIRRTAFTRVGAFEDDNVSFVRWLLVARDCVQILRIDRQVAVRRIHDTNMSLDPSTRAALFAVIREHRRSKGGA